MNRVVFCLIIISICFIACQPHVEIAESGPIVVVPDTGTRDTVLPTQEHPVTKSWLEDDSKGKRIFCRAFDFDLDGEMDVIFCWRDEQLVCRQWLNETFSYEKFFYDQDGELVSKQLWVSERDPQIYECSFGPLTPLPEIPVLDESFKKGKRPNTWVKKTIFGKYVAGFEKSEDDEIKTIWWNEGEADYTLRKNKDKGDQIISKIRRRIRVQGNHPKEVFSQSFSDDGTPATPLSTHIYPAPAFEPGRSNSHMTRFQVFDKKQCRETEIWCRRPHGAGSGDVRMIDENRDGNPEHFSVFIDKVNHEYVELADSDSDGYYESATYRGPDFELKAKRTKDDGTFDQYSYRKEGEEWTKVDSSEE